MPRMAMTSTTRRVLRMAALLIASSGTIVLASHDGGRRALAHNSTRGQQAPARVRNALACLLSQSDNVALLRGLGLQLGETVSIRYYVGTIPGSEPTPGELYIAVYAHGEQRAWLLIADPADHGRFLPIGNAYRLRKLRHGWQADEGNGGLGTYRTMSEFAARLIHQRGYRVQLAEHPEYCSGPEE